KSAATTWCANSIWEEAGRRLPEMARLDRLILREVFPIWCFGVAMFTVLIMAGSFLFEITRYLSQGADIGSAALLIVYLLPGIVAKTFAMAMLLGTLLAFGRLSGDSELVAMRAAGISVPRIMRPIFVLGLAVGLLAFSFNTMVVPQASFAAWKLKDEIKETIEQRESRPASTPVFEGDRLVAFVVAKQFDILERSLRDASVVLYDKTGKESGFLSAERLVYQSQDDWRIAGQGSYLSADGSIRLDLAEGAWPAGLPKPKFTPEDLYLQDIRDPDALSVEQIQRLIEQEKRKASPDRKNIANWEFGLYNKLSLPMAAIVFGLVGAALGIRSHRTTTASGFWLSVIIIFWYMLVTNVMAIAAQGGALPSWAASFAPIIGGLGAAGFLIWLRNR
ncbi:MAG: LptF/LptG family permease, partial [Fimbriimonadaceae bacterium]|nr:LptF/LptG family permease [Fimbriimonadaceae bacterium]